MDEKVVIFIDGSNLFHSAKDLNIKIDFEQLVKILTSNRRLIRAYYYSGQRVPAQKEEIKFLDKLRDLGITVRTRPLRERKGRFFEKGIDVYLVTDMLNLGLKAAYDTAIVVSGDNDYVQAIEMIKDAGIRVEVAAFNHSVGLELKRTCDKFISLNYALRK